MINKNPKQNTQCNATDLINYRVSQSIALPNAFRFASHLVLIVFVLLSIILLGYMMKRLPGPTELLCLAGGACTTPAATPAPAPPGISTTPCQSPCTPRRPLCSLSSPSDYSVASPAHCWLPLPQLLLLPY